MKIDPEARSSMWEDLQRGRATEIDYLQGVITAIAGRLWCGYACPQTVYTELFIWVEGWIEGDYKKQQKLNNGRWKRMPQSKKSWGRSDRNFPAAKICPHESKPPRS